MKSLQLTRTFAVMVLLVASLLVASVAARNDDETCRSYAKKAGFGPEDLIKVANFRMYGAPRAPGTCASLCNQHSRAIGFEYAGKQACCCGQLIE